MAVERLGVGADAMAHVEVVQCLHRVVVQLEVEDVRQALRFAATAVTERQVPLLTA